MKIEMKTEINEKEIFDRLNLQQIRNFIFEEVSLDEIDNFTYEKRLNASSILLFERINKLYKDNPNELDNAESEIITIMHACRDVYTEIGMKAGAKMLFQLLYSQ